MTISHDKYRDRLFRYGEAVNDLKSLAGKLKAMGMEQDATRVRFLRKEIKIMFRTYQQLWLRAEKSLAKAADEIDRLNKQQHNPQEPTENERSAPTKLF